MVVWFWLNTTSLWGIHSRGSMQFHSWNFPVCSWPFGNMFYFRRMPIEWFTQTRSTINQLSLGWLWGNCRFRCLFVVATQSKVFFHLFWIGKCFLKSDFHRLIHLFLILRFHRSYQVGFKPKIVGGTVYRGLQTPAGLSIMAMDGILLVFCFIYKTNA